MDAQHFGVFVDGEEVRKAAQFRKDMEGKTLTAKVRPREEWSDNEKKNFTSEHNKKIKEPTPALREPIYLFLFKTPISQYNLLESNLRTTKIKEAFMGDIPTMVEYRASELEIVMEPGFFYDVFSTAINAFSNRCMGCGARVIPPIPAESLLLISLDEAKMFAIEDLDLTLEQAKKLTAKVKGYRGFDTWLNYDFKFLEDKDTSYSVSVDEIGRVHHGWGHSKEKVRTAIGF